MKISEIQAGQGKIDVEGVIVDITPVKEIDKFGKTIKVATATLKDSSGKIKLSLWNEDTEKVNKSDKVKITNGYASEFKGEKQLTAGKFGKLEVLEKGTGEVEEDEAAVATNIVDVPAEEDKEDEEIVADEEASEEEW